VPIDVLVGVSSGAIVAGFYAGIGLSVEEMIDDARVLKGRHLFVHGLTLRAPERWRQPLRRLAGIIPRRLQQLDQGGFERLHYGVQCLGVVCHDLVSQQPVYFSTLQHFGVPLSLVVKSSASIPRLFPGRMAAWNGRQAHLVDGGLSDSLPCQFASTVLRATHLIVSDCRSTVGERPAGPSIVYVRPELNGAAVLRSPSASLLDSVDRGESAFSEEQLQRVRAWSVRRAAETSTAGESRYRAV
jgi:NTE family protein